MNGPAIVRAVLTGEARVTALVPATRIVADEVIDGVALPLILIKMISGVDLNPLVPAATVMVRQRVQIEIQAADTPSRSAIKRAVRVAILSNQFPALAGLTNISLHTAGEGPPFTVGETFVRIAEQDVYVTFSETTS